MLTSNNDFTILWCLVDWRVIFWKHSTKISLNSSLDVHIIEHIYVIKLFHIMPQKNKLILNRRILHKCILNESTMTCASIVYFFLGLQESNLNEKKLNEKKYAIYELFWVCVLVCGGVWGRLYRKKLEIMFESLHTNNKCNISLYSANILVCLEKILWANKTEIIKESPLLHKQISYFKHKFFT